MVENLKLYFLIIKQIIGQDSNKPSTIRRVCPIIMCVCSMALSTLNDITMHTNTFIIIISDQSLSNMMGFAIDHRVTD